jgi:uncharacterized protein
MHVTQLKERAAMAQRTLSIDGKTHAAPQGASTMANRERDESASFAGAADRDLGEKVEFLKQPAHYPHKPSEVVTRETHTSWVFLAGEYVFKLKKPVRNRLIDFSTLDTRELNCREEVRLNRRLSPKVYLGVVPLTRLANSELSFSEKGLVIDWLVKMRRLPAERMLDVLLMRHMARLHHVDQLAPTLASFYRLAERPTLSPEAYIGQILREQALNREIILRQGFRIDITRAKFVLGELDCALSKGRDLLVGRVRSGFIVEGHGDLKPEHVCFTNPIAIFDCLEFSRALRLVDIFDELAFFEVECALLDADWFGATIMDRIDALLGNRPAEALLRIYKIFRATLRARLCVAHLLDPTPREPGKWEPVADRYLTLAERYCRNG